MSGDRKRTISVVLGDAMRPRAAFLFESLASEFDVVVSSYDHPDFANSPLPSLAFRVYEALPDMQGYMRGLEDELAKSDIILAFETSRLFSFQALRASLKFGVPFVCLSSETIPFAFANFRNIQAIQADIIRQSSAFFASSARAQKTLEAEGVGAEKIVRFGFCVDAPRFKFSVQKREKFRNYIGIGKDDIVFLCPDALGEHSRGMDLLRAFRTLTRDPKYQSRSLKIIFSGDGSLSKAMKYFALDAGLKGSVLFLPQDTEPFCQDLYAATDVYVGLERRSVDQSIEQYPLSVLEAEASGLVICVQSGSLLSETLSPEGMVGFALDDQYNLTTCLTSVLDSHDMALTARHKRSQDVCDARDPLRANTSLLARLRTLLDASERKPADTLAQTKGAVAELLEAHKHEAALVEVEDALLRGMHDPLARAHFLRCRGDALFGLGRFEDSTQAFSEAMQFDDNNHEIFRGLGFLSLRTQALDEAMMFFRRALALNEKDSRVQLGLGMVHKKLNMNDQAIYWLERCVLDTRVRPAAVALIAQTCLELHNPKAAAKVVERILDVVGDSKQLLLTCSKLYHRAGQSELGDEYLERANAA